MYNDYNMGIPNYMMKKGINWNNILNNTQKTLGIINQAIPIVYQVKPLLSNARTLFKVANAINNNDEIDEDNKYFNNSNYNDNKGFVKTT